MNLFFSKWLILWAGFMGLFIFFRAMWFLSDERDREIRRDE